MNNKKVSQHLAYILYKIGNLGPEQIYYENIPQEIQKDFVHKTSIELGLYLSLIISQGKGLSKEGLFGPLPWYLLPEHELYLFSFLVNDPLNTDIRKKGNVLAFLVVVFQRNNEALIYSRYEIQKSLEQTFIQPEEKRIELKNEDKENIINSSKKIFTVAQESGTKLLQEHALDEILAFENIESLVLYSLIDKSRKFQFLVSTKELSLEDIFSNEGIRSNQLALQEREDGSISLRLEFKEFDILLYLTLSQAVSSKKLLNLLSKIDSSIEMLSSYI